jgi:hypothetical protein
VLTGVFLLSGGWSWADEPQINERFPIRDGENLSPPIVGPPIHECALAVSVSGFIPKATITVLADGVPVGTDNPKHGPADIPLKRALILGESITATQTVGAITSGQSYDAVGVTGYPTLTKPVAVPDIYQCGRVVPVGNLVASSHVDVWDTATPPPPVLGSGETTSDRYGVFTSSLAADHLVAAQQTACPNLPAKTAKSPVSVPLKVKSAPNPPPSPGIAPVPVIGSEQVVVHGLLAGAQIQINYGGAPIPDGYANAPDNLVDVPPVPPGVPVTAVQTLCTSSPPSPPVTATDKPAKPVLGSPICAGSHYVLVDDTSPGANVVLLRSGTVIGYSGGVLGTLKLAVGTGNVLKNGDPLSVVQYVSSFFGTFFSDPQTR